MRSLVGLMALSIVAAPAPLSAFPDGAPWGSADPVGAQSCASCHYAEEAVQNSDAILLTGMPEEIEPGKAYSLNLALTHSDYATMGFLAGASHGQFIAIDGEDIETLDAMVRSTEPKRSDEEASYWTLKWTAPADLSAEEAVTFHIAINASNDDASPFGDVIHYRTIQATVK